MARAFEESLKSEKQMDAFACASQNDALAWNGIDWSTAQVFVKRLQIRIAKATRARRWGKVKALQHLLTHSFYAKALAVKRVTQNRGKNTAGVDGVLWKIAKIKWCAIASLKPHGYRAKPLRRINIPKSNGKLRPLGIPTMRDRAMQALYRLGLEPVAEELADIDSYGFRPERRTADAIEACFNVLAKKASVKWILEADIAGCFDNIRHDWLLNNIPLPKSILRQWLSAGFIEKGRLFDTTAGTPQGGIISPILANMTLDGLQAKVEALAVNRYKKPRYRVIRYADDFVVTAASKEDLETEVLPVVRAFLLERGLALSVDKTKIIHINHGFDFLGQNVRKYQDKLLIKPAKKNVQAFLASIKQTIKSQPQIQTELLIRQLNAKILGWANYHRHIVASHTFNRVRAIIFGNLRRWARRRHPTKCNSWIDKRYFKTCGSKHWMFEVRKSSGKGVIKVWQLACATEVAIVRHVKVRREAHPYAIEYVDYFKRRALYKRVLHQRKHAQRRKLVFVVAE